MKRKDVSVIKVGMGSVIRGIQLNAAEYNEWTTFEVASLLVDSVIGADLEVHKVVLLIPLLKDKNWIRTLMNYSTEEEALKDIKEKVSLLGKEEQIVLATTVEICVSYLRKTFTEYIQRNSELQFSLVRFSDRFVPVAPGVLPYQNNEDTVKKMGRTLVKHIHLHQTGTIRNQTLLVSSDYFGSGKTRLGIEFLSLWKQQLDTVERAWLANQYSETSVSQLENSQLVYVDCRSLTIIENDLEKTCMNLKGLIELYIGGEIERTPCFIVLDEIGVLISSYFPQKVQLDKCHNHFTSMHQFLHKFFLPLQEIPTVSLYVCGKGAYLELIEKGKLNSPTLISKINLASLSVENIRNILEQKSFSSFVSQLEELDLFELYLEQLFEETKGVPFFVDYYLIESRQFSTKCEMDIMQMFEQIRNELPLAFSSPFNPFMSSPTLLATYKCLLFAGLLSLPINLSPFSKEFGLDLRNTEFEDLESLNYVDVALVLNCYLQNIPDTNNYLLIFPKAIIQSILKSTSTHPIPILYPIVEKYQEILSNGDGFEQLIWITFSFCIKWGNLQGLNIGDVMLFLKKTIIGNTGCASLNMENLKLSQEHYLQSLTTTGNGSIGIFSDQALSLDHIWKVDDCTFIGIKANNSFSFTELKGEIRMEEFEIMGANTRLLIILFYRCECVGLKKEEVFTKSITIGNETISLLENCSVVIVDGDATKLFLGKENIDALQVLSRFKSKK